MPKLTSGNTAAAIMAGRALRLLYRALVHVVRRYALTSRRRQAELSVCKPCNIHKEDIRKICVENVGVDVRERMTTPNPLLSGFSQPLKCSRKYEAVLPFRRVRYSNDTGHAISRLDGRKET